MVFNRITRILLAALVAPILWAGGALAYEQGTLEEAQAMAERAAAYFHAQGADAAFEAFNSSPDFHDRDLYVFAIGMDGVMAAHGANTNLVGRNVLDCAIPPVA